MLLFLQLFKIIVAVYLLFAIEHDLFCCNFLNSYGGSHMETSHAVVNCLLLNEKLFNDFFYKVYILHELLYFERAIEFCRIISEIYFRVAKNDLLYQLWLTAQMVRALRRYHRVTGSNHVES